MWIVVLLMGCAPGPKDSDGWIELYASEYCDWFIACDGAWTQDQCMEEITALVQPPAPDCEAQPEAAAVCETATPGCGMQAAEDRAYDAGTFWICPSAT